MVTRFGRRATIMDGTFQVRTEPLPADHPFWTEPRIHITPHISALTLREVSIAQIAGKIRALEAGEPIVGIVDLQRGY